MRSHVQIVQDAGVGELARKLGLESNTIYAWVRSKSIPAAYWRAIVLAGISTFEELATAAETKRRARRRA